MKRLKGFQHDKPDRGDIGPWSIKRSNGRRTLQAKTGINDEETIAGRRLAQIGAIAGRGLSALLLLRPFWRSFTLIHNCRLGT
jgi:hypothetical protein